MQNSKLHLKIKNVIKTIRYTLPARHRLSPQATAGGEAKRLSKGFTLIELLVVIGILGILASALVATIDPFEQLKKARDTNVKNTAVEFVNANIRYYTTHTYLPWGSTAFTAKCSTGGVTIGTVTAVSLTAVTTDCVQALIDDKELKLGFKDVTDILKAIYISGDAQTVVACFLPDSVSGRKEANTKYNNLGSALTTCPDTSGTSLSCYWCTR